MQAPQRKGKYSSTLKSIHAEQLNKLQQKHQQELELLDDLRLFSKQRASIEKDYAQGLVKLAEQFLNKRKFPPVPTFKSEDGRDYKMVWTVWKTVLEETRRVGEMRVQAAETYLTQISDPVKPLKASKSQVAKKVFDQCSTLQRELSSSVHDLSKSHKVYSEDEHVAHEAREKAADAEAKVKNKSTGLFTSLGKLQQVSAKLNTRRDGCDVKATTSRNEYLINLAAANAHSARFYNTEVPALIQTLDGNMYEQVQEYFTTLARSELECCGLTQECFMKILTDSCLVSRDFNLQCFLNENLVFTDSVQYQFEAQDGDQVSEVSCDHNATEQVEGEARKWTMMVAKETRRMQSAQKGLELLQDQAVNGQSQSTEGSRLGGATSTNDSDQKMEEIKNIIRKSQTGKLKGEAVLEVLNNTGVDIEGLLQEAEAEVAKQEEEDLQKSLTVSSTSKPSAHSPDKRSRTSSDNQSETQSLHNTSSLGGNAPGDATYVNYEDDDYVDEALGSSHGHLAQPAAAQETTSLSTGYHSMGASGRSYPLSCVALYDFTGGNSDELNLTEQEQLEVIGDGDGDGWVRARNQAGQEGLVPENYIQIYSGESGVAGDVDQNEMNVDGETTATVSPGYDSSAPPSAGWEVTNGQVFSSPKKTDTMGSVSTYSSTDYEVQHAVSAAPTAEGEWARALYDYDATCEEELSFQEGQVIKIVRRDENGIDDGWWEGELGGKIGVFPSLVVEELSSEAAAQGMRSPDQNGPPSFLPPVAPSVEVTQATPSTEHSPSANSKNSEKGSDGDTADKDGDNNTDLSEQTKSIAQEEDTDVTESQEEATSGPTGDNLIQEDCGNKKVQMTVQADVHVACDLTNTDETDEKKPTIDAKTIHTDDTITFADDDNEESII